MSDFPSLAEIYLRHAWRYAPDRVCDCGWCGTIHDPERDLRQQHAEHVTDAWSDACTITTAEQLESLPVGAVVKDAERATQEKFADHRWYQPAWTGGRSAYQIAHQMLLPALLIWLPEWTA